MHICTDTHRFNINYNEHVIYKYILYFWDNLQFIHSRRIIITQLLKLILIVLFPKLYVPFLRDYKC